MGGGGVTKKRKKPAVPVVQSLMPTPERMAKPDGVNARDEFAGKGTDKRVRFVSALEVIATKANPAWHEETIAAALHFSTTFEAAGPRSHTLNYESGRIGPGARAKDLLQSQIDASKEIAAVQACLMGFNSMAWDVLIAIVAGNMSLSAYGAHKGMARQKVEPLLRSACDRLAEFYRNNTHHR